jgi:hypothetical protein
MSGVKGDGTGRPPIDLDFLGDERISGLLGAVVALSGEVLVLKAEVKRLTAALQAAGVVSPEQLEAAGAAPELRGWIAREGEAQARAVLAPVLQPDAVADVRHLMPRGTGGET